MLLIICGLLLRLRISWSVLKFSSVHLAKNNVADVTMTVIEWKLYFCSCKSRIDRDYNVYSIELIRFL